MVVAKPVTILNDHFTKSCEVVFSMLLKFVIQDFYEDREFKNVTPQTMETYKLILNEMLRFFNENEVLIVEDVSPSHVKQYIIHCKDKGNKPTTTNTKLHRTRAFFNNMVECEVIKKSPATKVPKAKEDIRIDVFTDYHIKQLLHYYRRINRKKPFVAYRDHTNIIVLIGTGIRLSELTTLKWTDLDIGNQTLSLFGKNRKRESIPVTEKVIHELSSYHLYCEQVFGREYLSDYIFTNRYNKEFTPDALKNVFKRLARIMNFKDVRLSAHTFRHTFCQRCIHSGMSTFAIQKLMRHSSIAVTEKYAAMWGNDLKEQNDKYNPLNTVEV